MDIVVLTRSLLVGGICLVAGIVGVTPDAVAQQFVAELSQQQTAEACVPPVGTDFRPFLVYAEFPSIGIGGTPFPVTGTGGSADFDASNTPLFAAFTTVITNGVNDGLVLGFSILDAGTEVGRFSDFATEASRFTPNPQGSSFGPDVAGAEISFVRLIVDGLDLGPAPCPTGGPGRFAALNARWPFWGTPRPSILIVATGCNPCVAGQTASFVLRVKNFGPRSLPRWRPPSCCPAALDWISPAAPS